MVMDERDERGRFLPGWQGNRRQPGQAVYRHPVYPDRDSRGHLLPGHAQYHYPERIRRLKAALLGSISEDEMAQACRKLVRIALDDSCGRSVQLWAIGLILDHTIGKPSVAVAVQPVPEQPSRSFDLAKLSEAELTELARLLDKAGMPGP